MLSLLFQVPITFALAHCDLMLSPDCFQIWFLKNYVRKSSDLPICLAGSPLNLHLQVHELGSPINQFLFHISMLPKSLVLIIPYV